MTEQITRFPYSIEGLAQRHPNLDYFLSAEKVSLAKERLLEFIFDKPDINLISLVDESTVCLGDIIPISNQLDFDTEFYRIVEALKADGDLTIKRWDGKELPILTGKSLEKIAQIKREQLEKQLRFHQSRLSL